VNSLDPHPFHQRFDVPAAGFTPPGSQKTFQHPRPRERKLQVQFVQLAHEGEIGGGYGALQVIDGAAADAERRRLLGDRQPVLAVNHRFALSRPALVSAPSKKSFSSVSSPIFACSDFTSTACVAAGMPPPVPKTPGRAIEKLTFPLSDLIGVHIELLRQLGERLLPLYGGQSHLRLEGRCMVPARSLAHGLS
jgi:hypothetical protein